MSRDFYIGFIVSMLYLFSTVNTQSCPAIPNVAQVCTSSTFTGARVLVDMSTFTGQADNCSCSFTTNAKVLKIVTYNAPNYQDCNSAIRLSSSSGNSVRFECLMSGTYLDTSAHNTGEVMFETYSAAYDNNYCLVMEMADAPGSEITLTCEGSTEATTQLSSETTPNSNAAPVEETTSPPSINLFSSTQNIQTANQGTIEVTTQQEISTNITRDGFQETTKSESTSHTTATNLVSTTVSQFQTTEQKSASISTSENIANDTSLTTTETEKSVTSSVDPMLSTSSYTSSTKRPLVETTNFEATANTVSQTSSQTLQPVADTVDYQTSTIYSTSSTKTPSFETTSIESSTNSVPQTSSQTMQSNTDSVDTRTHSISYVASSNTSAIKTTTENIDAASNAVPLTSSQTVQPADSLSSTSNTINVTSFQQTTNTAMNFTEEQTTQPGTVANEKSILLLSTKFPETESTSIKNTNTLSRTVQPVTGLVDSRKSTTTSLPSITNSVVEHTSNETETKDLPTTKSETVQPQLRTTPVDPQTSSIYGITSTTDPANMASYQTTSSAMDKYQTTQHGYEYSQTNITKSSLSYTNDGVNKIDPSQTVNINETALTEETFTSSLNTSGIVFESDKNISGNKTAIPETFEPATDNPVITNSNESTVTEIVSGTVLLHGGNTSEKRYQTIDLVESNINEEALVDLPTSFRPPEMREVGGISFVTEAIHSDRRYNQKTTTPAYRPDDPNANAVSSTSNYWLTNTYAERNTGAASTRTSNEITTNIYGIAMENNQYANTDYNQYGGLITNNYIDTVNSTEGKVMTTKSIGSRYDSTLANTEKQSTPEPYSNIDYNSYMGMTTSNYGIKVTGDISRQSRLTGPVTATDGATQSVTSIDNSNKQYTNADYNSYMEMTTDNLPTQTIRQYSQTSSTDTSTIASGMNSRNDASTNTYAINDANSYTNVQRMELSTATPINNDQLFSTGVGANAVNDQMNDTMPKDFNNMGKNQTSTYGIYEKQTNDIGLMMTTISSLVDVNANETGNYTDNAYSNYDYQPDLTTIRNYDANYMDPVLDTESNQYNTNTRIIDSVQTTNTVNTATDTVITTSQPAYVGTQSAQDGLTTNAFESIPSTISTNNNALVSTYNESKDQLATDLNSKWYQNNETSNYMYNDTYEMIHNRSSNGTIDSSVPNVPNNESVNAVASDTSVNADIGFEDSRISFISEMKLSTISPEMVYPTANRYPSSATDNTVTTHRMSMDMARHSSTGTQQTTMAITSDYNTGDTSYISETKPTPRPPMVYSTEAHMNTDTSDMLKADGTDNLPTADLAGTMATETNMKNDISSSTPSSQSSSSGSPAETVGSGSSIRPWTESTNNGIASMSTTTHSIGVGQAFSTAGRVENVNIDVGATKIEPDNITDSSVYNPDSTYDNSMGTVPTKVSSVTTNEYSHDFISPIHEQIVEEKANNMYAFESNVTSNADVPKMMTVDTMPIIEADNNSSISTESSTPTTEQDILLGNFSLTVVDSNRNFMANSLSTTDILSTDSPLADTNSMNSDISIRSQSIDAQEPSQTFTTDSTMVVSAVDMIDNAANEGVNISNSDLVTTESQQSSKTVVKLESMVDTNSTDIFPTTEPLPDDEVITINEMQTPTAVPTAPDFVVTDTIDTDGSNKITTSKTLATSNIELTVIKDFKPSSNTESIATVNYVEITRKPIVHSTSSSTTTSTSTSKVEPVKSTIPSVQSTVRAVTSMPDKKSESVNVFTTAPRVPPMIVARDPFERENRPVLKSIPPVIEMKPSTKRPLLMAPRNTDPPISDVTTRETETFKPKDDNMNVSFGDNFKAGLFDADNNTYIIVVAIIAGLVVLAAVIGIYIHHKRISRSDKVDISGTNGIEPISHKNIAFENSDPETGNGSAQPNGNSSQGNGTTIELSDTGISLDNGNKGSIEE